MVAPAAGCPTPQPPTPEGQGGLTLALGKSFYSCGVFVWGGDGSGLDAILRPPQGPRAARTTAGGDLRSGDQWDASRR
ncbi:ABC transporter ATP-binding protein yojI [Deinococcus grandis]|uniref:ABC transporter ATP-binding protein yojI n=1 Tax=Deinococcus grandis TaxID=57498 RepID=A0A124BRR9_9DEIO|nr:hypothetical protein DEGR_11670 [Deinococcus grandis]GAQ22067.1 ABC transporter ATP-binding protein yojI [Deinococcus grandis]